MLDVGHNTLAAHSIAKALEGEKYTLVYNSYKDKNYAEILRILAPVVEHVVLIDVDEARIEEPELLQAAVEAAGLECSNFEGIEENKHYLVFGSFSVAERFLREYYYG